MPKKIIIGKEEWCSLPELGLPYIKARVDSGAKTSSLHAYNIKLDKEDGVPIIYFDIHPVQRNDKIIHRCKGVLIDSRAVKSSTGQKQTRPVIRTPFKLGKHVWNIEVTLTNRDSMGYRMLIGREAMKEGVLIDPNTSFCMGKKDRIKVRKYYKTMMMKSV